MKLLTNAFRSAFFASLFGMFGLSIHAHAKLRVVTTLSDLAAIAQEVGGDDVIVESIAKGTQDSHFIEAKPSFMVKLSQADLLISMGLGLESGWLPSIVRGARNPKITKALGQLELGPMIQPIEVISGSASRSQGDVHPEGNPHAWLDPIRVGTIAEKIAERLSQLDETHRKDYESRAKKMKERLAEKTKSWKARIEKTGVRQIVSYHKTLDYFFDRFGIQVPIELEPKPGIPPTSHHIMQVIQTVKEKEVPLIMIENFYDHKVANRIQRDVPKVRIVPVPVSVGGEPNIKTIDELFEKLVQVIEGKSK